MASVLLAAVLLGQVQGRAVMGRGDVSIPAFGPPRPHVQDPYYWTTLRAPQGIYPWYTRTGPPVAAYRNPNYDPAKVDHRGFQPNTSVYPSMLRFNGGGFIPAPPPGPLAGPLPPGPTLIGMPPGR